MKVLYPGSFDPITIGHENIINKMTTIFDHKDCALLVMNNTNKKHAFSHSHRVQLATLACINLERPIEVLGYDYQWIHGYITKFKEDGPVVIVRGLRDNLDLAYENQYQAFTREFGATTIYLTPDSEYSAVSSSLVRNLIGAGGNYAKYCSVGVWDTIRTQGFR